MDSVVITGIGLTSALGKNLDISWRNLIAGKTGISLQKPFSEFDARPLAMIGEQPVELQALTQLVVSLALKDSGLVPPLPDCGVVIGSSRAYQAAWEEMAQSIHQNMYVENWGRNWLNSLPHMNAISVARQIGATGIVLAPMAACATGISALIQATYLIQSGQCECVIAGAVEAPITPMTITGFAQMGALAKTGAYPFDKLREGLVLGEGGAVFILESAKQALQRNAKVYGKVLGFGLTADAYHPNCPEPKGKMASLAIKQCLQRGMLKPSDIDYIHAHGTATILNDEVESRIINHVFSHSPYVSSTKGATGHTIGASGALGVAFSLLALKNQVLPPCVGLQETSLNLNLVQKAHLSKIERVMCLSFGFGGTNAVIALSI
ncbi:MAG: beta-ketoacyl-ACP synthase [Calothrix sp. C42_A2020_038]|nr:beta-ketoacyl-ACP synthase [Calothrix sp. C42_A2020_038]